MTEHADERRKSLCVLDQQRAKVVEEKKMNEGERILPQYDASALIGLHTNVCNAAIEHTDLDGETTVELPKLPELLASAAIVRCLMPIKLRGAEIRAMRHIMKLTLADLAKRTR